MPFGFAAVAIAFTSSRLQPLESIEMTRMPRAAIAFAIGTLGFLAYIAVVVAVADVVVHRHWVIQLVFYLAAGGLWVYPAVQLMKWGAGGTGGRAPE